MKIVQQIYWKYSSNIVTNNEFAGNIFYLNVISFHLFHPLKYLPLSPVSSIKILPGGGDLKAEGMRRRS